MGAEFIEEELRGCGWAYAQDVRRPPGDRWISGGLLRENSVRSIGNFRHDAVREPLFPLLDAMQVTLIQQNESSIHFRGEKWIGASALLSVSGIGGKVGSNEESVLDDVVDHSERILEVQ